MAVAGGKQWFTLAATAGPSPKMSPTEFDNYMRMVDVWEELSWMGGLFATVLAAFESRRFPAIWLLDCFAKTPGD